MESFSSQEMQVEDGSGFNPSSVNPAIMKSGKEALSQERKHIRLPIQIVHALLKCWSVDRKESLFLPNSADRKANLTLPQVFVAGQLMDAQITGRKHAFIRKSYPNSSE